MAYISNLIKIRSLVLNFLDGFPHSLTFYTSLLFYYFHIWHAVKQMYSFSQVETRNRFRCLRSKPVDIEEKKIEREISERSVLINEESLRSQSPRTQSLKEREEFHDTFSFLIKLVSILNLLCVCAKRVI